MKTSGLHGKLAPMNDKRLNLHEQVRSPDWALDPLDEATWAELLALAYAARMRAVVHGAATAQIRTAQEVERLESLCLQRRQPHLLADVANIDPSYYLG